MNNEAFETLVKKLEIQAVEAPQKYLWKVYFLAQLGNLYLALILGLIVAVLLGMVFAIGTLKALAVKILFIGGAFLWMLLKAIWIQIPAPEGRVIHKKDAPELFAMIDEIGKRLNGPRFHEVLLVDDFNAAVVQSPRLGIFGFYKNYLLIGLPLLKTLSKAQFKSVLAHEFGHLAKGHGRQANWIYRSRLRWARLIASLQDSESGGSFLFTPFFKWYAPYFSAYSFPLARASEYQADAAAAELTSPRTSAQALTNVNVIGCYLEEKFWPSIHKQVLHQAQLNFLPFASMNSGLQDALKSQETEEWLARALSRTTSLEDTHPALSDRLKAIGAEPELAAPSPEESADKLLGSSLETVDREFDSRWQQNIQSAWGARYDELQKDRSRLKALEEKLQNEEAPNLDEKIEHACLIESINEDTAAALIEFKQLHEEHPDNPRVSYLLASRLLETNDPSGYEMMIACKDQEPRFAVYACKAILEYCYRQQDQEKIKLWTQAFEQAIHIENLDQRERNQVSVHDQFTEHGLSEEVIAKMRAQLAAIDDLKEAYLVRKLTSHFKNEACYVLAFSSSRFIRRFGDNAEKNRQIMNVIKASLDFPGETLIIAIDGQYHEIGDRIIKAGQRIL